MPGAMTARLAVVQRLVGAWSAGWILVRLPYLRGLSDLPDGRWSPVGVLAGLDAPPAPGLVTALLLAAAALGAFVALDRAPAPAVAAWAVLVLLVTTWASSWGQLFHTENLLALHALVLGAAAVARRWRPDPALVVQALAVVTVATYVVAGVAKLRESGLDWIAGDVLRDQVAFDNVRKAVVGGATSPIGTRLVDHGWVWPPLAAASLVVEVGAPLALLRPRLATCWVVAAWAFHVGVLALMAIGFPYQLALVAFVSLLPVERLHRLVPPRLRDGPRSAGPPPGPLAEAAP